MPSDADTSPIGPSRYLELDVIKALGILAVVLIHSIQSPFDPRVTPAEIFIHQLTRFAVPGFLAVSGFLYATRAPARKGATMRRLRRILLPYLVASASAQVYWTIRGPGPRTGSILSDLAFAASFGIYYYIFVIFILVLLTPIFARLPRYAILLLLGLTVSSQGLIESGTLPRLPWFWSYRNPLLWWGYFFVGWVIRLHYERVAGFVIARRRVLTLALLVALGVAAAIWSSDLAWKTIATAVWLGIYAILALLFTVSCGRIRGLPTVRTLSDSTYSIYLFHPFFALPLASYLRAVRGSGDPLAILLPWGAGIIGSLVVIASARTVFGRYSRDVVGT